LKDASKSNTEFAPQNGQSFLKLQREERTKFDTQLGLATKQKWWLFRPTNTFPILPLLVQGHFHFPAGACLPLCLECLFQTRSVLAMRSFFNNIYKSHGSLGISESPSCFFLRKCSIDVVHKNYSHMFLNKNEIWTQNLSP
jgi:hypothetical protein